MSRKPKQPSPTNTGELTTPLLSAAKSSQAADRVSKTNNMRPTSKQRLLRAVEETTKVPEGLTTTGDDRFMRDLYDNIAVKTGIDKNDADLNSIIQSIGLTFELELDDINPSKLKKAISALLLKGSTEKDIQCHFTPAQAEDLEAGDQYDPFFIAPVYFAPPNNLDCCMVDACCDTQCNSAGGGAGEGMLACMVLACCALVFAGTSAFAANGMGRLEASNKNQPTFVRAIKHATPLLTTIACGVLYYLYAGKEVEDYWLVNLFNETTSHQNHTDPSHPLPHAKTATLLSGIVCFFGLTLTYGFIAHMTSQCPSTTSAAQLIQDAAKQELENLKNTGQEGLQAAIEQLEETSLYETNLSGMINWAREQGENVEQREQYARAAKIAIRAFTERACNQAHAHHTASTEAADQAPHSPQMMR